MQLSELLPRTWPRHSTALDAYVRKARLSEDVELIWTNEFDALLLGYRTNHGGLSEEAVQYSVADCVYTLFFVTRPGLAGCRQSRVIIEELQDRKT